MTEESLYGFESGPTIDQTPQTQKTYARTFMSLVQAFTPDLGEAERESLINSLGILQPDYSALGRIQARAGDIYFVFGANAGKILIGVSPMPKQ